MFLILEFNSNQLHDKQLLIFQAIHATKYIEGYSHEAKRDD